MKRVLSFSFVAIIVFTTTFSCSKSNSNDPQSPVTVLSFSPAKGAAGTEVTITGTNFGVTPGENTVKFNGSIGTIISASATQLIAKVPLRAASGKISVISPAGMGKSENDFEVLAPVNTWAQAKSFSGGDKRYAVAFVVGDRAYVTTGIGSNGSSNDVWAYDAVNDTWTQKADFAGKARRNAIAFSIMDKGYVGLGNSGALDFEKDLWQYDPATNAWIQKANFKGAAREFASAFVAGNKGYVGMGNDGSASFYKDLYEYDPVANTWTQKASLYASPRTLATGFAIGSKGYIVAGFVAGVHTDQLFEYDPALDKWTGKKTFPGGARANAVAFTIGTKAYFGTGFGKVNTSNDHLKDVWEYDPAADNWEKRQTWQESKGPVPLHFPSATGGTSGWAEIVVSWLTSGSIPNKMRPLFYILLGTLIFSCGKKISYAVTLSADGYGYVIFINGKKVIDQSHLPGISTRKGFSDSGRAAITARYIIQKIENGQWPPSINIRELDSLGVLPE